MNHVGVAGVAELGFVLEGLRGLPLRGAGLVDGLLRLFLDADEVGVDLGVLGLMLCFSKASE